MKGQAKAIQTCIIVGCGKQRRGRGLCMGHYSRWREGRPLEGTLSPHGRVVQSTAKAVNTRISQEAWERLETLAEASGVSTYQYVSELLEAAARRGDRKDERAAS